MAWTAPRTWTTSELVTAAFMNTHVRDNLTFLKGSTGASQDAVRSFTNTSYLDLDALTGGSGTISAVSVSVDTDTFVIVHVGAQLSNSDAGARTFVSYRISGATTTAASDVWAMDVESGAANDTYHASNTTFQTVTAGTNVFEVQARVTTGTATISDMYLVVQTA